MKFACCPYLKWSGVLVAGVLTGMGLQAWFAGRGQAGAVQEKQGPSAEEQIRKLKIETERDSRQNFQYRYFRTEPVPDGTQL